MSGVFVVFEGGDGVGKSTQVKMLAGWLDEVGIAHRVTREPGDTWLGGHLRQLLLDPASGPISPRAEALVYAADKAQHVDEVVMPALAAGQVVVCDRYVDSTLAYQGAGRGMPLDELEAVARWATRDLRPHLTVLLDVDPQQAVHSKDEPDRLESAGEQFHRDARALFLTLAQADPGRYLVLDGRQNRDAIGREVRERLRPLLVAQGLLG
ncbi:dTMP kinase [Propionibacteriaceae bacterium G1746]|uniref:dTMP kinase n=1 Tax=Aestuariimicrobium sp. G57 TaxID=3418485 RepID=UPI003C27BB2C